MKNLRIIFKIFFTFIVLAFFSVVKASSVPVENIFDDITPDYPYYHELQTLYDKGMFFPDDDGEFKPKKLLERDEYVGIALEVNCNRCIVPNTEMRFINKYKIPPFFDVLKDNKYFYCISYAKDMQYVAGYNYNFKCEDGTYKKDDRPFCTKNTITREEALAVILRMGNILTAEDAEKIRENIRKGIQYPDLALDVKPVLEDGKVYSFYPDFQKALEYEVNDIDAEGRFRTLKLIEKEDNKFYPNKPISKEDFLKMAYVALKGNNGCIDLVDNNLALEMEVFDKQCVESNLQTCELSDMYDPENIFDLNAHPRGFCEKGIDNPEGYTWRFYHEKTREQFIIKGKFIDNHKFTKMGKRIVYLRVIDNCGNTAEVQNYFLVDDSGLRAEIKVYDGECEEGGTCDELSSTDTGVPTYNGEKGEEYDLEGYPIGLPECKDGIDNPDGYVWTITHRESGKKVILKGKYIDNYKFEALGEWLTHLEITDNCGNVATADSYFLIEDSGLRAEIKVYDGECEEGGTCDELLSTDTGVPTYNGEKGEEYDLEGYPIGLPECKDGIDNPDGYVWTITHRESGKKVILKGKYIDNYKFEALGEWLTHLEITDNCGNVATADSYFLIGNNKPDSYFLNISIDADPIIGPGPLEVDLHGIVKGSNPEFTYEWDFRDGSFGEGEYITHIFKHEGVYEVILTITDSEGNSGIATVLIKVTNETDCTKDLDNDGVNDCIDKCPNIKGSEYNSGCPVFDKFCNPDCSCEEGYVCGDGNPSTCSSNICRPKPIKLSLCLDSYKHKFTGITFGNAVCETCPCENNRFLDFVSALRFCDTVFPAITSPDEKKIYERGNLFQIKEN